MSMFNDISCGTKDNKQLCLARARLVSLYARKSLKGQWSISLVLVPKRSACYSMKEDSPQEIWDKLAEKMLIEFAESTCPIFRATTLVQRSTPQAKDMVNFRFTLQPFRKRLRLFFA